MSSTRTVFLNIEFPIEEPKMSSGSIDVDTVALQVALYSLALPKSKRFVAIMRASDIKASKTMSLLHLSAFSRLNVNDLAKWGYT
jgi:hypothetical protein